MTQYFSWMFCWHQTSEKDTRLESRSELQLYPLHQAENWWKWSEVKSLSRVWLFATRWTVARQAPLSMGFSRQEYWSGLPFPSPEDLPNPGIEPGSPALEADALISEPEGLSKTEANKLIIMQTEKTKVFVINTGWKERIRGWVTKKRSNYPEWAKGVKGLPPTRPTQENKSHSFQQVIL